MKNEPLRIDAHHHFWRLERGDYGWLTADLAAIHRDFGPEDMTTLLRAASVDRTILVQAAPTAAETEFLLDLAERTPFVAAVVGWVDFADPKAPERIAALSARGKLKGLRPMIQDIEDDAWMLRPDLGPVIEAMIAHGLRFDALIKPRHLQNLRRFASLYPSLDIVIDHAAKPDIAGGDLAAWERDIRAIAAETQVLCKLSGLATEAAPGWSTASLRPVADVLLGAFGPRRLMWGSDWPVLNLNGEYARWVATAEALTAALPDEDIAWIFGRTAKAFYGLDE